MNRQSAVVLIALGSLCLLLAAGRETVEIDADETGAAALRLSGASGGATISLLGSAGQVILGNAQGDTGIVLDGPFGNITCVNLVETSTRSMKNNIQPIADALAQLVRLRGVEFTWDECVGGRRDVGLIAEEVAEVVPELVRFEADGVTATGMNYTHLTAVIVEAVKELAYQNQDQFRRSREEHNVQWAAKDAEIAELKARLARVEAMLAPRSAE